MAPSIGNVKAGAQAMINAVPGLDIQSGVGNYRDFTDPVPFKNQQAITANQAAVINAINGWSASGGDDLPEAGLYGLHEVVSLAGWRAGSEKFIVWFGDAPGHEPICKAVWSGPFDITRAT